ncbi:hypothetical protein B0H16DRAFT_822449 [Mycena metata]|uniref:Uncharacterized protein n=1 Tax=Mycena metata TaxID=1033252 RepID=A0AAD7IVY9_9AGAR|nr:hypothetical protein B0H16DRAFT_822449 [Mycena metata]
MLFWILTLLVAKQSGLTQGHSDLLDSRASTEATCDCTINSCRTMFDIVWGCLATIFACTWVALHQNVPDPELGQFSLLMRKLRMMLVTIIAPELVVAFAGRQLTSALWISEEFNISKTHAFFFNMGGFVSDKGHYIANARQIPAYISAIKAVKEADILDKSKGDALSKGVALAQALWFVTQCVARTSQCLPLTELEVATLAFAILSSITRLMWWWKPLDVQQPIILIKSEDEIDPLEAEGPNPISMQRVYTIDGVLTGQYPYYSPISATSVPSFYSTRIGDSDPYTLVVGAGVFGSGAIFGAIHCAAWNTVFPSVVEMRLWRMASGFIAGYPVLFLAVGSLYTILDEPGDIAGAFVGIFLLIGLVFYPFCRLVLSVLSFTTLRALSSADFVDVNWSKYFPHL